MMEMNIDNEAITNEQLEICKSIIKTVCNKQVEPAKPFELGISVYKLTDDYHIRISIMFPSTNSVSIGYRIRRYDIEFEDCALIPIELNESGNNEHLLVIPLGGERTLLMLNCFEAISNNNDNDNNDYNDYND